MTTVATTTSEPYYYYYYYYYEYYYYYYYYYDNTHYSYYCGGPNGIYRHSSGDWWTDGWCILGADHDGMALVGDWGSGTDIGPADFDMHWSMWDWYFRYYTDDG